MKRIVFAAAIGLIGLSGCSEYDAGNNTAYLESENAAAYGDGAGGNAYGNASGTASANWPAGSRIVVEDGVTYRIEPGGTRVVLGTGDARIVEEGGVRFRVDPDGTRVRIDDDGAAIEVDSDDVDASVNLGGNTSVEVNTQ